MIATDPVENLLGRLDGVRQSGRQWAAQCPAHEDRTASLSVCRAHDGRCLVYCHAGCSTSEVVAAVQLSMADLMVDDPSYTTNGHARKDGSKPEPSNASSSQKKKPAVKKGPHIATFDYVDAQGNLLYQTLKYALVDDDGRIIEGEKTFRQRRPDGSGGWVWNLDGVELVPYRLPELIASNGIKFVMEGEKDCDTAIALGLSATTNPMGAGKWHDSFNTWLMGCDVIVIADHDAPGEKHARQVARSVHGQAKSVRIIELPGLENKGADFSDWCNVAFGDAAEPDDIRARLVELVSITPEWEPPRLDDERPEAEREPLDDESEHLKLTTMATVNRKPVTWLWDGHIPAGSMTMLDGDPGLGKSQISCSWAATITTGGLFPGEFTEAPRRPRDVLMLSSEDDIEATIKGRLEAAGADCSRVHLLGCIENTKGEERLLALRRDIGLIEQAVREKQAAMLVVDPFVSYLDEGLSQNTDADVRRCLAPLGIMAQRTGCAVVLLRHLNKKAGSDAVYRGGGSIGIIGAARAGFMVARSDDDEDAFIFAPSKFNLAKHPESLTYSIEPWEDVSRIVWGGTTSITANEMFSQNRGGGNKTEAAKHLILGLLAHGARGENEVRSICEAKGISLATYKRARQALNVNASKSGFDGGWILSLGDDDEGAQP